MRFDYAPSIQRDFPDLSTCILHVTGVEPDIATRRPVEIHTDHALRRLEGTSESAFVEIQAWRRAYAKMGLKPTQYRCASEALLRRLRKTGSLPTLHPLIDLCNALSVAYAVPVAVFDMAQIAGNLSVRPAIGTEQYLTFSGETEAPDPGEVIFSDQAGHAHARRWANRQSLHSAVTPATTRALIVAEAQHLDATDGMRGLLEAVIGGISEMFGIEAQGRLLNGPQDVFVVPKDVD